MKILIDNGHGGEHPRQTLSRRTLPRVQVQPRDCQSRGGTPPAQGLRRPAPGSRRGRHPPEGTRAQSQQTLLPDWPPHPGDHHHLPPRGRHHRLHPAKSQRTTVIPPCPIPPPRHQTVPGLFVFISIISMTTF